MAPRLLHDNDSRPRREPFDTAAGEYPAAMEYRSTAEARLWRASELPDRVGQVKRISGWVLAECWPGQRERERERRVSDADASYYARV
jgi:hypothetical protein